MRFLGIAKTISVVISSWGHLGTLGASHAGRLEGLMRELGRTCELEDFCGEVFEDRGGVYRGFGAYADVVLRALLEVPMDTTYGELSRVRAKASANALSLCASPRTDGLYS